MLRRLLWSMSSLSMLDRPTVKVSQRTAVFSFCPYYLFQSFNCFTCALCILSLHYCFCCVFPFLDLIGLATMLSSVNIFTPREEKTLCSLEYSQSMFFLSCFVFVKVTVSLHADLPSWNLTLLLDFQCNFN